MAKLLAKMAKSASKMAKLPPKMAKLPTKKANSASKMASVVRRQAGVLHSLSVSRCPQRSHAHARARRQHPQRWWRRRVRADATSGVVLQKPFVTAM